MSEVQFDDLDRFVTYADKHFELGLLAGCFATERCEPGIPDRAVGLTLALTAGKPTHVVERGQGPNQRRVENLTIRTRDAGLEKHSSS